jgi:hypothetical protein
MRVYLPATSTGLRRLVDEGSLGEPPMTAFAVTPALREWYVEGDADELEYAALREAALASLRLLDADPDAWRRRVVVAADVPDAQLTVRDDLDRGVVHVTAAVAARQVAAVHVDDPEASEVVAAAAAAVTAADLGQQSAQEAVDDAEGFELSWYASQELPDLLGRPDR